MLENNKKEFEITFQGQFKKVGNTYFFPRSLFLDKKCPSSLEFPDNVIIDGDLYIGKYFTGKLSKRMIIKGSLYMTECRLTKLPDGISIYKNIDLNKCKMTSLPKNLKVRGYLNISYSSIEKLPEGLVVSKFLAANDTPLRELPKNLKVGSILNISRTFIEELPEEFSVEGLIAEESMFTKIPDCLKDLYCLKLQNSKVTILPDNMLIRSSLDLTGSPIKYLPKGLVVKESLRIKRTNIKTLPADIIVGCSVEIDKELHYPSYIQVGSVRLSSGLNSLIQTFHSNECFDIMENSTGKFVRFGGVLFRYIKCEEYICEVENLNDGISKFLLPYHFSNRIFSSFKDAFYVLKSKQSHWSNYKHLTLKDSLSFDEAVICYMVITNACIGGVRLFIDALKSPKETYTIEEIIELTKGEMGNEGFSLFFKKH